VYFDETSCKMWMRQRMTWSSSARPVKFPLNMLRGKGVTILGAIGECLPKMVSTLAQSTNRESVVEFLHVLREVASTCPMLEKARRKRLVLVLDNHRAHVTPEVTTCAEELDMELLFLPPYCPELNSIETLWAQVKRLVKQRLTERSDRTLGQQQFEQILRDCLNEIGPAQQKHAARFNNRDFIYRQISEYLNPQLQS